MAGTPLTHFDPDPALLEPLREATEYQPWDAEAAWSPDWPGNILSKRTVIYGDGTVARLDDPVSFAVDPDELDLCRRLATEAASVVEDLRIAGGSADHPFRPFYNAAGEGRPVPDRIDAGLIRARFSGTIFPEADLFVEPMAEAGDWWSVVEQACEGGPDLDRWKGMIAWFRGRPEFVDTAYVRIGDNLADAETMPESPDVEAFGVVMPRLAVGLTRRGSLVGLSGCVVLA